MLFKRLILLFCFWAFTASLVNAQNDFAQPAPLPPKENQCTSELFYEAEDLYRQRKFVRFEGQFRVEHLIRQILDVCPNASLMTYLHKRLEIIEEERAEHNFVIGNFYFKQSVENKKGGLKGAQARFREIVEKYPDYSKMDEVLFKLGETYLLDKDFEKAKDYFQTVIEKHPDSEFADKAKAEIARINDDSSDQNKR